MNVAFLLPPFTTTPSGGYRVVFEYANRLADRGHRCQVYFLDFLAPPLEPSWVQLRRMVRHPSRLSRSPDIGWFDLRADVGRHRIRSLEPKAFEELDGVVLTSWQTVEGFNERVPRDRRPPTLYLVQGHETWAGDQERVEATWSTTDHVVAVSSWLGDLVRSRGAARVDVIHSGIDDDLGFDGTPADRRADVVLMSWSSDPNKGSGVGLAALQQVREWRESVQVVLFTGEVGRTDLPSWAEVHVQPSRSQLRGLYNRAAVYVTPGFSEGWALPNVEAMACGAAVVSTDLPGIRDYAEEGRTALLAPIGDAGGLASAIGRLLDERPLRRSIAEAGRAVVGAYRWEEATSSFEQVLRRVAQEGAPSGVPLHGERRGEVT